MMVGLVKTIHQIINATTNSVDGDGFGMAPSVAEADEILARFGYVESEAVAA